MFMNALRTKSRVFIPGMLAKRLVNEDIEDSDFVSSTERKRCQKSFPLLRASASLTKVAVPRKLLFGSSSNLYSDSFVERMTTAFFIMRLMRISTSMLSVSSTHCPSGSWMYSCSIFMFSTKLTSLFFGMVSDTFRTWSVESASTQISPLNPKSCWLLGTNVRPMHLSLPM